MEAPTNLVKSNRGAYNIALQASGMTLEASCFLQQK